METTIGKNALIPNPALKPLEKIVGRWNTTGIHPYFPGVTLYGRAVIEWIEGGAFLIVRSEIDEPHFPNGIEIFGSDDVPKKYYMLHFDERGISRKFDVTIEENVITWNREDSVFSQHYVLTIEDEGNRLISKGQMSRDSGPWEKDLELTYTRIK